MMQTAIQTNRVVDFNGWTEIKGNPISKVGVFPYFGYQIDPSLIPDQVYNVLRPEEELCAPECIESFKLVPWVDNHEMLGPAYVPAESKGIEGVVGEDIYYENGYLKANLKIFSERLADLIENGKKELSIGYKCLYELTSGVYNGTPYVAIQRCIRGNHLASVDEGRAGPDVAVLDHFKFTFDEALLMEAAKEKDSKDEGASTEQMTISDLIARFEELQEPIKQMQEFMTKFGSVMPAKQEGEEDEAGEPGTPSTGENPNAMDEDKETIKAMDARIKLLSNELKTVKDSSLKTILREVSQRDELVSRLNPFIGVFDHKEKSLNEVASYAVDKLGLKCDKGQELALLNGFLAAKNSSVACVTLDSNSVKSSALNEYITGGK